MQPLKSISSNSTNKPFESNPRSDHEVHGSESENKVRVVCKKGFAFLIVSLLTMSFFFAGGQTLQAPIITGTSSFCAGANTTLSTASVSGYSYCWQNLSSSTTWQNVGTAGFTAGRSFYQSLAFNGNTPYVAYQDEAYGSKASVMKLVGTNWVNVGNPGFSANVSDYNNLVFIGTTPYVAFRDGGDGKCTVMKFDGTNWVNVGNAQFTAGSAGFLKLATNGGVLYVAFQDGSNNYAATVMNFNGTDWVHVGNPGFSAGSVNYMSFAFAGSTPYVAFADASTGSQKTTVMKFDGSSWVNVGNAQFTPGATRSQSLAVDGNTPYVAFMEDALNFKTSVMKFDGTNWVFVGNRGLSAGSSAHPSLAINNNTPYVAYQDDANFYKTAVMKYNGTAWIALGGSGISSGFANYQSLVFNGNTPYVAFADESTNYKTTVMKYELGCVGTNNSIQINTPGTYTVTVTNSSGSAISSPVAVTAGAIPTVSCPGNMQVCANAPVFTLTGGSPAGGVYTGPGIHNNQFNSATAGTGIKTITYTYTDPSTGCSNSCSFTITVDDTVSPVITPLSNNIVLPLNANGTRTVTLADIATIVDNCNPIPAYSVSPSSFDCSTSGVQTITVTATDGVFASPLAPDNVKFSNPGEIKFDQSGNLYIADNQNNRMRKLAINGDVTTIAGNGTRGFTDGTGTNATLDQPSNFTIDATGNIFLSDALNNKIRKITPAGVVTTYAGSTQGNTNGSLSVAKFNSPRGLVFDSYGNLFVADLNNSLIRKITPAGVVSTFAGNGTYTTVNGTGTSAGLNGPHGLTIDANDNIYFTELFGNTIRKVTPAGVVSTIAGTGTLGMDNGPALSASFKNPADLVFDNTGNLYVVDNNQYMIRRIRTDGVVESLGTGNFINKGIAVNANGVVYLSSIEGQIKKILPDGTLQLVAGNTSGGYQDGNVGAVGYGNQSTLQIPVTIQQQAPIFTSAPQAEITISVGANCTAPIPDFKSSATATSGCGGVTLTQSPTQGVPAPLGRRPVTIIATDIYGRESYQTSYINIVDATAPIITPISNNIVLPLNANGTRTITLADVATIIDNCNPSPLYSISPSTFNCSTLGLQNVTVTATDGTLGTILTPSAATFNNPFGLDFDVAGNLYIADQENNKIRKISASGIVSTLAGSGNAGYADGTALAAVFNDPRGIAIDASGNVYTSDIINHRIRKITPSGVVTTFAGGAQGFANGTGTSAQFSSPRGLAFDAQGNLYVADAYNARIRKITPGGVVTTLAGNGNNSSLDGPVTTASIYDPVDVAVDAAGNIYVAEASGNKIRKISTSGMVSTIAGDGTYGFNDGPGNTAKFSGPQALSVDSYGNVYVADFGTNRIRKINTSNVVSTLVISGYPSGVTIGSNGNLYMTDFGNYIKMITPTGVVTTLAGANQTGSQDGSIGVLPTGNQSVLQIQVTITGQSTPVFSTTQANVSVAATASCQAILANYISTASASSSCGGAVTISQTPAAGTVLSIGSTPVTLTATDASNNTATQTFNVTVIDNVAPVITPLSNSTIINLNANGTATIDASNIVSISDCNATPAVRINPSNFTCADIGNKTITVEATDGTFGAPNPGAASFNQPAATAVDQSGNVYVAEWGQKIRKISTNGEVTTIAGSGISGFADGQGTAAAFRNPTDLVVDQLGNIFVADASNRRIRKITTSGNVSTFAGNGTLGSTDGIGTNASFDDPYSLTIDLQGNLYVGDRNKVRKISATGVVSTLAGGNDAAFADGNGTQARFWGIAGLVTDASGNIYVADGANNRVRKITPEGVVSTIAGNAGQGYVDGPASSAKFTFLHAITRDGIGNLYVCDNDNRRIRKISPDGIVSTLSGSGLQGDQDGSATTASFNGVTGIAVDNAGYLYVAEFSTNKIRKISPNGSVTTLAGSGIAGTVDGNIGGTTGNLSTLQILVAISDNTAPVISCPANITTPTNNIHPNQTGSATATDNCTAASSISISYTDNTAQGCYLQRTWKATDASGNFSTCVQSIAIPQMSVSLGQDMYVLYGALGYVGCRTITPVITGGVAPYTYVWTSTQASVNNSTTASISVCNTTEVAHAYTVTVTAANGCVATSTLQLTFINISCSKNNNNVKVTVCLRPQGNPNNCNTVCVSESAAQVLIDNGSYYGKCLPGCEIPVQAKVIVGSGINSGAPPTTLRSTEIESSEFEVRVMNNPTSSQFSLVVYSMSEAKIKIRVMDVLGRILEIRENLVAGREIKIGQAYKNGVFLAEITQGKNKSVVKLIKQ